MKYMLDEKRAFIFYFREPDILKKTEQLRHLR